MNNSFEKDPRRIRELKGRPIADIIYKKKWGNIIIKRFDKNDNFLLDKEYAIDVEITMPNGMKITGQEKFLSFNFANRNTLTVEFMQDFLKKEKGDWYKLTCQFYMCAYFNKEETNFIKYGIVNWLQLVLWTNESEDNEFAWDRPQKNTDGKARASFKPINFKKIPSSFIIDKFSIDLIK